MNPDNALMSGKGSRPPGKAFDDFDITNRGKARATYDDIAREAVKFLTYHERDIENAWKRGRISFREIKNGVQMRDEHRTLTVRCRDPKLLVGLIQDRLVVDHGWRLGDSGEK